MSLNAMGLYLRSAVKQDLDALPDVVIDKAITADENNAKPWLRVAQLAGPIYRAARAGRNPIDTIRGISGLESTLCRTSATSPPNSGELCAIVVGAKVLIAFETHAVSTDGQLFDESQLGVAAKAICKALGKNCDNGMPSDRVKNDLKMVKATIRRINELVSEIKTPVTLQDGTKSRDPTLRLDERVSLMDEMLDLIGQLVDMGVHVGVVESKDVNGVGHLRDAAGFAREMLRGDEAAFINGFLIYAARNKMCSDSVPEQVKRVIPVAVEIANAQTSKDVANVLETAAAPVGSYRQKSQRSMTSVTAFLGLAYTHEQYTINGDKKNEDRFSDIVGPVGVHLSYPWHRKWDWARYWGWYATVIDIGPLVNTHDKSGVKSQPNTSWKQLLSPGIYGTVHLNGPVTLGAGLSRTPEVLKTEAGEDLSPWRFQIFVAIDVTLFPF